MGMGVFHPHAAQKGRPPESICAKMKGKGCLPFAFQP